ncbi:UDP-N-acetylmuramoyl-L-alanine--D-glutamate ligase [Sphingomonas ginkgonis]|uniref:UDP-N-acetylmuramoylalanine--D-glutamate ligase n=1 Tax=Sphingomonas ginkgonis TaxID=2315330 RepID=A0A3R9X711_9SPHN|nr:UDP-N-acetylmuramoyl-L-alanine--D-glutamate ligase [Sphingomonas ginkgonis]RST30341.1 UDP-N-acetylmuramoyl-L-alanine--D-glutamate ligase [Sphingomonas ginkgonis]
MITARAWAGRHYAVYGLARSGLATVRALLASGATVTAWDEREVARAALKSSPAVAGEGDRSPSATGGGAPPSVAGATATSPARAGEDQLTLAPLDDLSGIDALVLSPGVPLNTHPLAARAREAGVEIIGDIELFARARPELPAHNVVGITGTNGKSTTTALVHHILKTAGVPTTMGGNIGLPILAQNPLPAGGVYVLELSSYQIDLTQSLDCDVAVLLNITPDHLDRYDSFEAYAASKARLFDMSSGETVIVGSDAPTRSIASRHPRASGDPASSLKLDPRFRGGDALVGPHNEQNILAALLTAQALGIADEQIADALHTYPGLPHRMERVANRDGVLFVNDSKATNAESAAPALAAFERVRWIVGGLAKTEDLGPAADHLGHVAKAYTIGKAGPMFARLLEARGVAVEPCETLENAVNRAAADSQPGDVVLLSPASASFDQFRDFEARGEAFRNAVGALS